MFLDGRASNDEPLYDPALTTHVAMDLGYTDSTVMIWWQTDPKSGERRIVKCQAFVNTDVPGLLDEIHSFSGKVGDIWLPHDARAVNLQTGKTIVEQFLSQGIRPRLVPKHNVRDGISAARVVFPSVRIDFAETGELVEALKAYRRSWDENAKVFKDKPVHDWASDFADAFRYFAIVCAPAEMRAQMTLTEGDLRRPALEEAGYNLETLHADAFRPDMRRIA